MPPQNKQANDNILGLDINAAGSAINQILDPQAGPPKVSTPFGKALGEVNKFFRNPEVRTLARIYGEAVQAPGLVNLVNAFDAQEASEKQAKQRQQQQIIANQLGVLPTVERTAGLRSGPGQAAANPLTEIRRLQQIVQGGTSQDIVGNPIIDPSIQPVNERLQALINETFPQPPPSPEQLATQERILNREPVSQRGTVPAGSDTLGGQVLAGLGSIPGTVAGIARDATAAGSATAAPQLDSRTIQTVEILQRRARNGDQEARRILEERGINVDDEFNPSTFQSRIGERLRR